MTIPITQIDLQQAWTSAVELGRHLRQGTDPAEAVDALRSALRLYRIHWSDFLSAEHLPAYLKDLVEVVQALAGDGDKASLVDDLAQAVEALEKANPGVFNVAHRGAAWAPTETLNHESTKPESTN